MLSNSRWHTALLMFTHVHWSTGSTRLCMPFKIKNTSLFLVLNTTQSMHVNAVREQRRLYIVTSSVHVHVQLSDEFHGTSLRELHRSVLDNTLPERWHLRVQRSQCRVMSMSTHVDRHTVHATRRSVWHGESLLKFRHLHFDVQQCQSNECGLSMSTRIHW